MNKTRQKYRYNHSDNVINGNLCKECQQDKTCKDKGCPVHKWRK